MINTALKQLISSLLALLFALALPQFLNAQFYSLNINDSNGKTVIKVNDGKNKFQAEYSGEISLSEDEKDIIAISNNGYIEIKRSSFGKKRRVRVETDSKGKLIKKYFIGRKELAFVPDGEKWLAEVLPEISKHTTIGAFARVDNLYCKGGVEAVLDDIAEKESDYVKVDYFDLLLGRDLPSQELQKAISLAGKTIESDHYLTELLQDNQRKILAIPEGVPAYVEAARSIESDHYKTEVLASITDDPSVSDQTMLKVLGMLDDIESDHYLSEILTDILDERVCTAEIVSGIVSLARNIESDHYKTEVYEEAISQKGIDARSLGMLLDGVRDVESDHYYVEVISELCDQRKISDDALAVVVENVFADVDSDHYKTEALDELLESFEFESAAMRQLIRGLRRNMDSDNYTVEIVNNIADNQKLNESDLTDLIYALEDMSSDSYLAEALLELEDHVAKVRGESLVAYKKVASSIESDHYYREAMDVESFDVRSPRAPRGPKAPTPPKAPKKPKHRQ